MPTTGSVSKRLFGLSATESARAFGNDGAAQRAGEPIAADTFRKMRGPKANGHFAFHSKVTSAFGASSVMTVWYSCLPDPDETSDADWVQDTTIGSIDLTSTAGVFFNVGNVNAEWIRFKVDRETSDGALWVWTRVDGQDNR